MSGKKKNLITLLSLCAILVVCLVLYFVLPKGAKKEDPAKTTNTAGEDSDRDSQSSVKVDSLSMDQIQMVTVEKKGKEVWTLKQKKKDSWVLAGREKAPVNQELVKAILGNVDPVTATQQFEAETEDLSAYGLDHPSLIIKIKMSDGKQYRYEIGSEVPKSDLGYYGKTAAGTNLYCLDPALVKAFDVPEISLIKMDSLPEPEADYLTYISVHNRKGKDFAAKRVSDREKVDFYSNWNITAPYAKPLATSQSEWSNVLTYFTALSYEEMVDYDSPNLKEYGLQTPRSEITVKYYQAVNGYTPTATATPNANVSGASSGTAYVIPEDKRDYKTFRLCVGKKTQDSYYVCEKGKRNVYKMSASMVENMTGLNAYTNMDHCVYSVLATSIRGYDVTYGDTTLKVTRKSVSKDGTETTQAPTIAPSGEAGTAVGNAKDNNMKNIWSLNGKTIPDDQESDFLKPYSLAYLLEYSEQADEKVKKKNTKPVLTIVYHEDNRDVTVKYLPYDGINFYRVDKNGMDYFLVDKLLVDDVIEKFKGIEKMAK